jgi:hypothetical protein
MSSKEGHIPVQRLDLPMGAFIENIERFGQGTNQLLKPKKDDGGEASPASEGFR